jgi:hypothetical protein
LHITRVSVPDAHTSPLLDGLSYACRLTAYSCEGFLRCSRFLRRNCFALVYAVSDCLSASNTKTNVIVPSGIRIRDPISQTARHGAQSLSEAEVRKFGFVVLKTATMRSTLFWDLTPCRLIKVEEPLFSPPDSCLVFSCTPKTEAVGSAETSVD